VLQDVLHKYPNSAILQKWMKDLSKAGAGMPRVKNMSKTWQGVFHSVELCIFVGLEILYTAACITRVSSINLQHHS
jgi:hypothetical protein